MRMKLILVFAGSAALSVACGISGTDTVSVNYINTTESLLCLGPDSDPETPCEGAIKPRAKTKWTQDCYGGAIVELYHDRDRIYQQEATCDEWRKSGAVVIIKREGTEFLVTDSLPSP
jgi:hypothetical protein